MVLMLACFLFLALTGAHEEIDYSAKLKFSDDEGEEEGEEERTESNNDLRYVTGYIQHVENYDNTVLAYNMAILYKLYYNLVEKKLACFSLVPVSSRGPRMPPLQPLALEPRTAAERRATPLPLMLTMAPNPPPVSQDGPRREAVAGLAREHHPTTR